MIVGLSGTHGTGKSTMLNYALGQGYLVDQTQLSRSAQRQLGWDSLSRAQESVDNMWALQSAILDAMYDRDQKALGIRNDVVLVDRTPADIWAYTAMWCKRLGIEYSGPNADPRVVMYKQHCRDLAQRYSMFVVVPPVDAIPFVAEPNRADLESRKFVEDEINNFIIDGGLPYQMINTVERAHRASELESILLIAKFRS